MPAPLLALRPRLHDPGAEGAEKLVPETEPPLGLSCLPLGMKPQSPDGALPSRAKASLVHPADGGTCGGKAPKSPGGSTSPRGRVPTSSLLPWGCPTCGESTLQRVVLQELGCVQGMGVRKAGGMGDKPWVFLPALSILTVQEQDFP